MLCWLFVSACVGLLAEHATAASANATIRRDLNFTDLVTFDGYNYEVHTVTTRDGYKLSLFRVLARQPCAAFVGEPVVFQHGLYLSGDDCILPGPGGAHCYLYADQCRDVWIPNSRGNFYSRAHVSLNPDTDPQFWDFSWEDMALEDTPAVIDYVLDVTGKTQLAWVSHSQGATILMYCTAKLPAYNDKITVAVGLSPTAWLDYARFIVLKVEEFLAPLLAVATAKGVNTEFLPRGAFYQPLAKALCGTSSLSYEPCSEFYFSVLGDNMYQINEDVLAAMTGHLPSGTSLQNFYRWGDIKKNGFREMNLGTLGNLKAYGQATPPIIDLSNVTTRWIFIDSVNDYVSDPRDLATLTPRLPAPLTCILSNTAVGHLDYLFGDIVKTTVVPMITNYLDTGSCTCL